MLLLAWKKLADTREDLGVRGPKELLASGQIQLSVAKAFEDLAGSAKLGPEKMAFHERPAYLPGAALEKVLRLLTETEPAAPDRSEVLQAMMEWTPVEWNLPSWELAQLMWEFTALAGPSRTLYAPFTSSVTLASLAALHGLEVCAEAPSTEICQFYELLNILLGLQVAVKWSDPVLSPGWVDSDGLMRFDSTLCLPPMGVRYPADKVIDRFDRFPERTLYGEVLQIRHILAQTKGKSVTAVPGGLLFRTAAGERAFKADLVQTGKLNAVIGLPSGFMGGTSLPVFVLVLDSGGGSGDVYFANLASSDFVDGTSRRRPKFRDLPKLLSILSQRQEGQFSRRVSFAECEANDYNLTPERYVSGHPGSSVEKCLTESPKVELGLLVDIIRPQSLHTGATGENFSALLEVAAVDIGRDGYVREPKKTLHVAQEALSKAQQQKLCPGDILLLSKGANAGAVAMVREDFTGDWVASQSFLVLRPHKQLIDNHYLLRYLRSPLGLELLGRLTGGGSVPMLQSKDVKKIPVIKVSQETLAQVKLNTLKIAQLSLEIKRIEAEIAREEEAFLGLLSSSARPASTPTQGSKPGQRKGAR